MIARILKALVVGIFLSSACFAEQNEVKTSELIVLSEAKLTKLLEGQSEKDKHEASGVLFLDNKMFVVFDNYSLIARISIEVNKAKLLGENKEGVGFEGITYDNINDRFYLIEESIDNKGP